VPKIRGRNGIDKVTKKHLPLESRLMPLKVWKCKPTKESVELEEAVEVAQASSFCKSKIKIKIATHSVTRWYHESQ